MLVGGNRQEPSSRSMPYGPCPCPEKRRHPGQGRCKEKAAFAFGPNGAMRRGGSSEISGKTLLSQRPTKPTCPGDGGKSV